MCVCVCVISLLSQQNWGVRRVQSEFSGNSLIIWEDCFFLHMQQQQTNFSNAVPTTTAHDTYLVAYLAPLVVGWCRRRQTGACYCTRIYWRGGNSNMRCANAYNIFERGTYPNRAQVDEWEFCSFFFYSGLLYMFARRMGKLFFIYVVSYSVCVCVFRLYYIVRLFDGGKI